MAAVQAYVMAGLGTVASNGIIYDLAAKLQRIPGVAVRVGDYSDYIRFANEAKQLPAGTKIVQVGHSLGASVAPKWARILGRPVSGLFGFDPADNAFANPGQYGLSKVPGNVSVARAVFVPGGALGGGGYEAEGFGPHVENHAMPGASHTEIDSAVREHLTIEEFAARLAEA